MNPASRLYAANYETVSANNKRRRKRRREAGGSIEPTFLEAVTATNPQAFFRLGSENDSPSGLIDALGNFNNGIWNRGTGVIHTAPGFVGDNETSTRFNGTGFADTMQTSALGDGLFADPSRRWSVMSFSRVGVDLSGTLIARAGATLANRTFHLGYNIGSLIESPLITIRGTRNFVQLGLDDGTAHNLILTWDGSVMKLYVDGLLWPGTLVIGTAAEETTQKIIIGQRTNGAGAALTGDIGEIAFWNRALSSTEIRSLYTKKEDLKFIIGSSTMEGFGSTDGNSFAQLLTAANPGKVTNLAYHGTVISEGAPDGSISPAGWEPVNVARNVTCAIDRGAKMLIIGYPSNEIFRPGDVQGLSLSILSNIVSACVAAKVDYRIFSAQPRTSGTNQTQRDTLRSLALAQRDIYGSKCIETHSELANPDGTLKAMYDSGDGIHLNNTGHLYLYNRYLASF